MTRFSVQRFVVVSSLLLLLPLFGKESALASPVDGVGQPQVGNFQAGQIPADPNGVPGVQPPVDDDGRQFVEPKNPHGPNHGQWYLGVYGTYTTTGHLLTQVFPNTPASRAGLEPGDRIVTVNGDQVGEVNQRLYPIDVLLQRHASRNGFVRLLVQDRRTSRLVNVDVRLTRGRIHF